MALPSLAFGIGLSGKPIDRAALNLRREEGAQRAKAKEADDKRKKLEPYQKLLMDVGGKAYLPFQRKLMQEKVAGAYEYLANNAENVDWSQLGGIMTDISQSAALYQNDYKTLKKAEVDPDNAYQAQAFKILSEIDNPEDIRSSFGNYAGLDNFGVNADNTVNFTKSPFTTVTDYTAGFVNKTGNKLFESITEGTLKDIYDRKVVTSVFKPEVYETVVQGIYKDPIQFRSSRNEYEAILRQQNQVPDFTTQEGVDKFNQELDQYIRETSKQTLDNYTKETLLNQGKGSTFNINIGGGDGAAVNTPFDTEVLVKVGGVDMGSDLKASFSFGDSGITIPPDSETFSTDGKRQKQLAKNIKYNKIGVANVLGGDFVVPETVVFVDNRNRRVEFKKGQRLEKGMIIPNALMEAAINNNVPVDAKMLAFGKDAGNKEVYTDATSIIQSQYSKAAANKQPAIVGIYDAQIDARDNIKQLQSKVKPKGNTPTPTPTPSGGKKQTQSTTPSGNTNSRIENNPSLQDLINKRKPQ